MEWAAFLASWELWAFFTFISTNLVAPSPSATIILAKERVTKSKASRKICKLLSPSSISSFLANPLAKMTTISLVLISLSMVIILKDLATESFRVFLRARLAMRASVVMKESIVAK